jgi:hypothetical protein
LNTPQSSSKPSTYEDENGKEVLAFMTKTAQGWKMVAQQETGEAFRIIAYGYRNALMLLGGTLLLVVLVSLMIAMERLKKAKSTPEKASSWFLSGNGCVMGG